MTINYNQEYNDEINIHYIMYYHYDALHKNFKQQLETIDKNTFINYNNDKNILENNN